MIVDATMFGQFIFIIICSVPVVGFISYYLGRKKTNNPIIAGFIGAALSIFPPLNFIFIAVLCLKKDVN